MNKQANRDADKQVESLTDLTLTTEQTLQTKGGAQLWGEGKKVTIDFCKTDSGGL
jgi:hypothetical protein